MGLEIGFVLQGRAITAGGIEYIDNVCCRFEKIVLCSNGAGATYTVLVYGIKNVAKLSPSYSVRSYSFFTDVRNGTLRVT